MCECWTMCNSQANFHTSNQRTREEKKPNDEKVLLIEWLDVDGKQAFGLRQVYSGGMVEEREGECSISKWIDLLCCICVTKFLPLNDSSMSNVIFYSLHQFAWPSNLLTWLNMDCELAGQVNLARDFTTQNNWDCVRLLPSPSNQFFFISFAFPWKFESDFNANKPFRAQMNFSRNRNNVLVFNAF